MGKINFDERSKFKRFLSGKGFYVALAVCLVAVCGVAVGTFVNSLPQAGGDSSSQPSSAPTAHTTKDREVDNPVTNVPDDRTTTTGSTTTTTVHKTTGTVNVTVNPTELFVLPLSNEVLVEFSDGKQVYSRTMDDWRTHDGVDFKGEKGQKIKALADGTILAIEEDTLWGKTLTIDHGFGIQSRYCGIEPSGVKKGDKVKVSDVIGTLTDIPCELLDGPHLHVEITVNGEYTDPVEAIGREVKAAAATTGTTTTKQTTTTTTKKTTTTGKGTTTKAAS